MRHDYTGPIYIQVTGPTGWQASVSGLAFSMDDGANWLTTGAAVVTATATPVTLATGQAGTRCYVSIPATTLPISALRNTLIELLVKLTSGADTPVMSAQGKFWIE